MDKSLAEILEARMSAGDPVPVAIAIALLRQVCDVLAQAHAQGLVHHDIQPRTISIGAGGASLLAGAQHGAFAYAAPEYVQYSAYDPRSDLYSLGVVAHEVLANEPLFSASPAPDAVSAARARPIQPPSELNPAVPEDLDAIVLALLAPDPDHRFQNAAALAAALAACAKRNAVVMDATHIARWAATELGVAEPDLHAAATRIGERDPRIAPDPVHSAATRIGEIDEQIAAGSATDPDMSADKIAAEAEPPKRPTPPAKIPNIPKLPTRIPEIPKRVPEIPKSAKTPAPGVPVRPTPPPPAVPERAATPTDVSQVPVRPSTPKDFAGAHVPLRPSTPTNLAGDVVSPFDGPVPTFDGPTERPHKPAEDSADVSAEIPVEVSTDSFEDGEVHLDTPDPDGGGRAATSADAVRAGSEAALDDAWSDDVPAPPPPTPPRGPRDAAGDDSAETPARPHAKTPGVGNDSAETPARPPAKTPGVGNDSAETPARPRANTPAQGLGADSTARPRAKTPAAGSEVETSAPRPERRMPLPAEAAPAQRARPADAAKRPRAGTPAAGIARPKPAVKPVFFDDDDDEATQIHTAESFEGLDTPPRPAPTPRGAQRPARAATPAGGQRIATAPTPRASTPAGGQRIATAPTPRADGPPPKTDPQRAPAAAPTPRAGQRPKTDPSAPSSAPSTRSLAERALAARKRGPTPPPPTEPVARAPTPPPAVEAPPAPAPTPARKTRALAAQDLRPPAKPSRAVAPPEPDPYAATNPGPAQDFPPSDPGPQGYAAPNPAHGYAPPNPGQGYAPSNPGQGYAPPNPEPSQGYPPPQGHPPPQNYPLPHGYAPTPGLAQGYAPPTGPAQGYAPHDYASAQGYPPQQGADQEPPPAWAPQDAPPPPWDGQESVSDGAPAYAPPAEAPWGDVPPTPLLDDLPAPLPVAPAPYPYAPPRDSLPYPVQRPPGAAFDLEIPEGTQIGAVPLLNFGEQASFQAAVGERQPRNKPATVEPPKVTFVAPPGEAKGPAKSRAWIFIVIAVVVFAGVAVTLYFTVL